MLAAITWNDFQRNHTNEKVDMVKYSKRRGAFVLETRAKKSSTITVPPCVTALMGRLLQVVTEQIDLPAIDVPQLQRLGRDIRKPSTEELREARHQP